MRLYHSLSVAVFALTAALFSVTPVSAGDLNALALRGNVATLDISTVNGVYEKSNLWVWSDDPAQQLAPVLVRCNANSSTGQMTRCDEPAAMLPCARTSTTWTDGYMSSRQTTRYRCVSGSRRDAGACVDVLARVRPHDAQTYVIYSYITNRPEDIQATMLETIDLSMVQSGWVSASEDCTAKP